MGNSANILLSLVVGAATIVCWVVVTVLLFLAIVIALGETGVMLALMLAPFMAAFVVALPLVLWFSTCSRRPAPSAPGSQRYCR